MALSEMTTDDTRARATPASSRLGRRLTSSGAVRGDTRHQRGSSGAPAEVAPSSRRRSIRNWFTSRSATRGRDARLPDGSRSGAARRRGRTSRASAPALRQEAAGVDAPTAPRRTVPSALVLGRARQAERDPELAVEVGERLRRRSGRAGSRRPPSSCASARARRRPRRSDGRRRWRDSGSRQRSRLGRW